MKRFFMSFLAIFFPWVILLIEDNPGGAFLALILQATAIGWPPASIWAWKIVHGKGKKPPPPPSQNLNPQA
jgi:uncharacterized membrane protein YqaE (UPF0057 family)